MAARLDLDPSSYSRLLSGAMKPSIRVVRAIARAFPELRAACVSMLLDDDSPAEQSERVEAAV
jgi:hypothetical protein